MRTYRLVTCNKIINFQRLLLVVGWYSFVFKLQYKANWYGKQVVGVAPAYTTQIDYETGEVVKKPLDVRKYVNSLGHVIDRDLNASLNIRDKALATL